MPSDSAAPDRLSRKLVHPSNDGPNVRLTRWLPFQPGQESRRRHGTAPMAGFALVIGVVRIPGVPPRALTLASGPTKPAGRPLEIAADLRRPGTRGARAHRVLDVQGFPLYQGYSELAVPVWMCGASSTLERLHFQAMMADVQGIEVVTAHRDRATMRVGDVFLKVDVDQARTDVEIEAMAAAPVPTPEILWRQPPVLALAALPGRALGRLDEPSTTSRTVWAAAGAALRTLHSAPLPPRPGRSLDELASRLDEECAWLVDNDVQPLDVVTSNRRRAETVLRPWTPVFIHGDFQITHVFVDGDEVTGIIDWSEAAQGDALYDVATLTLAHEERLDDVITGYDADVDLDLIRAWWSFRSLTAIRWLADNGYGSPESFPEVAVLRSQS